jgi:hypothetical protein
VEPHHFDSDPDSDPDLTYQLDADPNQDPSFQIKALLSDKTGPYSIHFGLSSAN